MIEIEASTPKTRLLEVLTWGWRVASVGVAIFFMVGAMSVYSDRSKISDSLSILALYVGLAVAVSAFAWTVRYVATGSRENFASTIHKTALGSMSYYWWLMLLTAYAGGMAMMVSRGSSDDILMQNDFAEGLGQAVGVIAIGCIGRLLTPKRYRRIGHIMGTLVVGALYIAAVQYRPDLFSVAH